MEKQHGGRRQMPKFVSVLKEEIVRLARKELRNETEGLKKASSQYRTDIAALKRRVGVLEKQLTQHAKKANSNKTPQADTAEVSPMRFSAKGLSSQRQRLGLSAAEMGLQIGRAHV